MGFVSPALRTLAILGAPFLAAYTPAHAATPAVLIVQETTPVRYGKNFDVPVLAEVAQELDDDGRVLPIMWSLADPLYRAAVEGRMIPSPKKNPTLEEAQACGLKLKAEYVLLVKAVRDRTIVDAQARLFKADKLLWTDKSRSSVTTEGGFNSGATAASLARTWVLKMCASEFKGVPTRRRMTPDMDPGQARTTVTPEPPRKFDDKQLAADAAAFAKQGQSSRALALLREGVDAAPFDPVRRRMLIDFLSGDGQTQLAADEAKRAAVLLPETAEFHVLAARAYMRGGDSAQAQNELNEAVARDPESFETRLLLGELSLMKLDLKTALAHLDKALEKGSTPDALFKRAAANALLGNKDAAAKDMADALKAGEDEKTQAARYEFATNLADLAVADLGDRCTTLTQKARLKSSDPDVQGAPALLLGMAAGIKQLIELPTRPTIHTPSHERRVLALNLLTQSLSQIQESLKNNDADSLADAAANLGEALKQSSAAKEAYKSELQKPAG